MIAFLFFIQTTRAQTYLAHKATNYLSKLLHTRVEVKGVDIEFFKKIVLEDVFIEDLHHDTLMYAKKLKLNIGEFNIEL